MKQCLSSYKTASKSRGIRMRSLHFRKLISLQETFILTDMFFFFYFSPYLKNLYNISISLSQIYLFWEYFHHASYVEII